MKKTQKILLSIIVIIAMLIPNCVLADSFAFKATADKSSAKGGETVTITLGVSDIDAGELGINTVEAMLSYDSTIFEEVTQSSFNSLNNWSLTYNGEETAQKGKILGVILVSGVKENQNIGTVTLKVKENVEYAETIIKITDIKTNNGQTLIEETDKEIPLTVGTKPVDGTDGNNNNGATATGGESNTKNEQTTTGKEKDSTVSNKIIPKAGETTFIVISIFAIALILAAFIGYKKYKNIDR